MDVAGLAGLLDARGDGLLFTPYPQASLPQASLPQASTNVLCGCLYRVVLPTNQQPCTGYFYAYYCIAPRKSQISEGIGFR